MKMVLYILLIFIFISCEPEPEFYINGKPYYTDTYCDSFTTETKWGYHFGYNYSSGNFEYFTGFYTQTECVHTTTDTIEIKKK